MANEAVQQVGGLTADDIIIEGASSVVSSSRSGDASTPLMCSRNSSRRPTPARAS